MAAQNSLQTSAPSPQQIDRPLDAADRPTECFRVGDKLPLALSRQQLAGVIGVSCDRLDIYRLQRSHPAIKELLPRVGHPRFSGAVAQAWLDQQVADERKFFASARRR